MTPSNFVRADAAVVAAIASLFAADAAAQSPAARATWDRFLVESAGSWVAQWNEATDTPRVAYGNGIVLEDWRENTLVEARRHANEALLRHADLLGVGSSELVEITGARMGRTYAFTFEQRFRGMPVVGGRVDVRIHMSGKLVHLGSTAWPVEEALDLAPRIGEDEAVVRAWAGANAKPTNAPQPGNARAPRLVLVGIDSEKRAVLAWEVQVRAVDAEGKGPIGRAYVDAKTGAFVRYESDKHECGFGCAKSHESAAPTPSTETPPAATLPATLPAATTVTVLGYAHTQFSPVSTPTNAVLRGVEVQVPGVGTFITDQNGQFTVSLTAATQVTARFDGEHTNLIQGANAPVVNATLQPGSPATIQFGSAASGEFELAHATTYYWTDRVHRFVRSVLGDTAQLDAMNLILPSVNLASTCNAYYTNNTINFYASGGGCNNTSGASVIAHEWGHGLDEQYSGISQANGLSEAWADITSMYLLDDPTIGHDFFSGGGGIRSGNNTQQYPNGAGPHDQGLSWMGCGWLFRESLRQQLGTQQAQQISNDVFLGSIVAGAGNQQDAVVAAFQADDDDGILGNGTPHYAQLSAACIAHSLPYPQQQPGALSHTTIGSTVQQATPRYVEVVAAPYTGSWTQVRLHWNDGAPQQRNMVALGQGDRWRALLPGQMAPTSVSYHFEAVHSSGAQQRMPVSGEYLYVTRAERRVYFEGFENGATGWSHGAITGLDEWEIGAPQGRSGSAWQDPAVAATGSNCAGTDLGLVGDGLYQPGSNTWLRSPSIDCTGISGTRLRFRRQLTCPGPLDFGEIRINGTLVWRSPFTSALDSTWTTFDLLVPSAANNPSVVVEFRMVSGGSVAYGGWNIDDVEIYSLDFSVPLAASMTLLPEQAQVGAPIALTIGTGSPQLFLMLLGDAPGPLVLPGIATLQTNGNVLSLFGITNAQGVYSTSFVTPNVPVQGFELFGQTVTQDAGGAFLVSNPWRSLLVR